MTIDGRKTRSPLYLGYKPLPEIHLCNVCMFVCTVNIYREEKLEVYTSCCCFENLIIISLSLYVTTYFLFCFIIIIQIDIMPRISIIDFCAVHLLACVDKVLSPLQSVICFTSEAPCPLRSPSSLIGCQDLLSMPLADPHAHHSDFASLGTVRHPHSPAPASSAALFVSCFTELHCDHGIVCAPRM